MKASTVCAQLVVLLTALPLWAAPTIPGNPPRSFETGVGNQVTLKFSGGRQVNNFTTKRQRTVWTVKVRYENRLRSDGTRYFDGNPSKLSAFVGASLSVARHDALGVDAGSLDRITSLKLKPDGSYQGSARFVLQAPFGRGMPEMNQLQLAFWTKTKSDNPNNQPFNNYRIPIQLQRGPGKNIP